VARIAPNTAQDARTLNNRLRMSEAVDALVVDIDGVEMIFASVEEFKRYINTGQLPIDTTKRYIRMPVDNFDKCRLFKWSEYKPSKL